MSNESNWQPRFYAVCALSAAGFAIMNYAFFPRTWFGGIVLGYAVAGVFALLLLAIQHKALRTPTHT